MLWRKENQMIYQYCLWTDRMNKQLLHLLFLQKCVHILSAAAVMRSFPVWSMWVRISFMTMLLIFSNEWSTACQVNHIYRLYKERAISIAVTTLLPTVWISSMGLVLLMVMSVCTFPMNYKGLEMENLLGYRSLHSTYGGDMFWVW